MSQDLLTSPVVDTDSIPTLRFMTCGSVDDGKSTLIGRVLIDSGNVYQDQLEALRADTQRFGTTSSELDPALLLDGLEDERQQGITIDVAYRFFQTPRCRFIVADSPGHEQYTRNMVTAASNSDVAVILIDASKGVLPQTRRHAAIALLLGIKRLIVAVNKMDRVNGSISVFDAIRGEFLDLLSNLPEGDVQFIPVSGLTGDNVVHRSSSMNWYKGPTLLEMLESAASLSGEDTGPLRIAVQRVVRPHADYRGYSGTIATGCLEVGQTIQVSSSGQEATVRTILSAGRSVERAAAGEAVTFELDREIDITRGDLLVEPTAVAQSGKHLEVVLVAMSEQPLVPGKSYRLRHTSHWTSAEIEEVDFRIDIESLKQIDASSLKLNEIGRARITTTSKISFDQYRVNRQTGALILCDRVTHQLVAAGLIVDPTDRSWGSLAQRSVRKSTLTAAVSRVTLEQRAARNGHVPFWLLLTGLSGSGKTTVALELEQRWFNRGLSVTLVDGQSMRLGLSRDLGFSAEERSENLRRAAEVGRMILDTGMICIAAFVAPDAASRERARNSIGAGRWLHVHLKASPETCRQRDQTGRYSLADRGLIKNFPGVTHDYQVPTDADLVLDAEKMSVAECIRAIDQLVATRYLV